MMPSPGRRSRAAIRSAPHPSASGSDAVSLSESKLLIGGELVDAASGTTYENVNPATGAVIGVAPDASATDLSAAIGAARDAFDDTEWSTDVALRVRCLRQLRDAFVAHADEIRAT